MNSVKCKGVVNDTIADMLTRLRNAHLAKQKVVVLRASGLTCSIAQVMFQEGFLAHVDLGPDVSPNNGVRTFAVTLKRPFKAFNRVSTSGVRVYVRHKDIPRVLNGMGIAILSTSQGIMTDQKARACGIGGELICYVW
jgi:small subunit ribosomal protein S8